LLLLLQLQLLLVPAKVGRSRLIEGQRKSFISQTFFANSFSLLPFLVIYTFLRELEGKRNNSLLLSSVLYKFLQFFRVILAFGAFNDLFSQLWLQILFCFALKEISYFPDIHDQRFNKG